MDHGVQGQLGLGRDHILRALEGSRDVVAQRDADILRAVEHDVRTRRNEAAIAERLGDVADPDRGAGRQSGEARAGDDTMQIGHHVLDGEPGSHAA